MPYAGVSHLYHCGDATFVLMLHINDDAFDDMEHTSEVSRAQLLRKFVVITN